MISLNAPLKVSTNIKGQSVDKYRTIGQTTLIYSPENGGGKTAIINALTLALWGFADDIRGQSNVKDSSKIISLAPDDSDLEAYIEIDGVVHSYYLRRGKDPQWIPPTERIEEVHVLINDLMKGDQTTMRRNLVRLAGTSTDVTCLPKQYNVEFVKLSIALTDPITRLELLRDAADGKMRAMNKRVKEIDSEIASLRKQQSAIVVLSNAQLADLESEIANLVTQAKSVEVKPSSSYTPSDNKSLDLKLCETCGQVISEVKAANNSGATSTDFSTVQMDILPKLAAKQIELERAVRAKEDHAKYAEQITNKVRNEKPTAEQQASYYKLVKQAAATSLLEEMKLVKDAAAERIQTYVPNNYTVVIDDNGMISLSNGGVPSGAEWCILQAAIGAAMYPNSGLFIVPDRSWGPNTLATALAMFTTMPIRIIVQTTTFPSYIAEGVTVIDLGFDS